jgi:hypothetical protein
MKAEELRIGNLVQDDYGQIKVVNSIDFNPDRLDYTISFPFGDYEEVGLLTPIPLTEELLLKFGFEILLTNNGSVLYRKNSQDVNIHPMGGFTYGVRGVPVVKIKHVHQLQNLYFTLTGEEL